MLKRGRIKHKTYAIREAARHDVFDYIEMFYNPIRRHGCNGKKLPVQFVQQFFERQQSVKKIDGDSIEYEGAAVNCYQFDYKIGES